MQRREEVRKEERTKQLFYIRSLSVELAAVCTSAICLLNSIIKAAGQKKRHQKSNFNMRRIRFSLVECLRSFNASRICHCGDKKKSIAEWKTVTHACVILWCINEEKALILASLASGAWICSKWSRACEESFKDVYRRDVWFPWRPVTKLLMPYWLIYTAMTE